MKVRKPNHFSIISQPEFKELRKSILPKINYLESHKLLKLPKSHIMSMTALDFKPVILKKPNIDVTDSEVRNLEWVHSDLKKQEKLEFENVKLLDHWIYNKGLHKKTSTAIDKLPSTNVKSPNVIFSECQRIFTERDEFIIGMVSNQLKIRKVKDAEKIRDKSKEVAGTEVKISRNFFISSINSDTNISLRTISDLSIANTKPSSSSSTDLDKEINLELYSLQLRQSLSEKKEELQVMLKENDDITQEIKQSRLVHFYQSKNQNRI